MNNHKIISHWKQLSLTDEQVNVLLDYYEVCFANTNVKDHFNSLAKNIATERFVKEIIIDDFTNAISSGQSIMITECST